MRSAAFHTTFHWLLLLNISYNIRRKASEATAEVRSDMQLDHVLFHQCK